MKKVGKPETGSLPHKYWTHVVKNYKNEDLLRPPIYKPGTVGKMYYWCDDEWWDAIVLSDNGCFAEADDLNLCVYSPGNGWQAGWYVDCWEFWPLDIWEKEIKNSCVN